MVKRTIAGKDRRKRESRKKSRVGKNSRKRQNNPTTQNTDTRKDVFKIILRSINRKMSMGMELTNRRQGTITEQY